MIGKGITLKLIGSLISVAALLLSGCSATNSHVTGAASALEVFDVSGSYLEQDQVEPPATPPGARDTSGGVESSDAGPIKLILEPIDWQGGKSLSRTLPLDMFSTKTQLSVSAEKMSLRDFIHYAFGELLRVNYVVDKTLEGGDDIAEDTLTLSIANSISSRDLFKLVRELLLKRDVQIKYGSGTFFIHRLTQSDGRSSLMMGVGRGLSDIPETAGKILQVVPLHFGIKVSVERTLRSLITAKITPDFAQSALYIEGSREEVVRAIEIIDMLDIPAMRGRYIGFVNLDFVDPTVFADQVMTLLENEGIDAAVGRPKDKNLVLVPLPQFGALAVFAANEFLLERVRYWATLVDVPGEGPSKRYFLYSPRYASAKDLDNSISALLGLSSRNDNAGVSDAGGSTGNAPSAARNNSSIGDVSLVVDETANMLVFYTSGSSYKALLPLLDKLDVMPKQVMLDILIAEVSLKDEFKHGVEWAIKQGETTLTTQGAFGASSVGGLGILIDGNKGPVTANFLATNSLENVLSRPTIMVRDGTTASINVGSQISVVGQTTQDPINGDRQTTSSVYRNTGVDVTVTPTVNASGIVVMEVSQNISNSVPGALGSGGNPDIFRRLIKTEVLANSGQTVMLGGLISENRSVGGSGAPGLSTIPLLGNLFKSRSNTKDRTELVMLITPRILENPSGWAPVMDEFQQGLMYMQMNPQSD